MQRRCFRSVADGNLSAGVRPNSGAKEEVWMRNSCMASTETRLFVPLCVSAGRAPAAKLREWAVSADTDVGAHSSMVK